MDSFSPSPFLRFSADAFLGVIGDEGRHRMKRGCRDGRLTTEAWSARRENDGFPSLPLRFLRVSVALSPRRDGSREAIDESAGVGMVKIKRIDHVAVAVDDVDAAIARWREVLGVEPREREVVASQKTEAVLLPIGDSNVELISPKGNEGLRKFLDKRGPGLHHVAIEVEGIEAALAALAALGVPLVDATPRLGARGHKVAFLHPKATGGVLVELVEPVHEADPPAAD